MNSATGVIPDPVIAAPPRLECRVATVVDVRDETPRARTLVLDVPQWSGHRAGQHVDVRLVAEDGYQAQRSYSLTAALATCTGCGTVGPVGALLEYGHGMGLILRCPACDTAVLRIVHTPGWLRVDASGVSLLMIPESVAPGAGRI